MARSKQFRNMSGVFYCDPSIVLTFFARQKVEHYAYICHDKDVKEDGTLKQPHYHFVAHFSNPRMVKGVLNQWQLFWRSVGLENDTNMTLEGLTDKGAMILYFTHENEEGKALYQRENIVSDDLTVWLDEEEDTSEQLIIQSFLEHNYSPRYYAKVYPTFFFRNAQKMVYARRLLKRNTWEEMSEEEAKHRLPIYEDEKISEKTLPSTLDKQ